MANAARSLGATTKLSLAVAMATLGASACAGPDRLLEPVVSEGGAYFASLGGNPSATGIGGTTIIGPTGGGTAAGGVGLGGAANGGAATGGSQANGGDANGGDANGGDANGGTATGGSQATGGSATFDWGTSNYDVNGGSNVTYQGHFTGMACLATCHAHAFTAGGTVYQANGTATAANAQIGILVNGTLTTTYSGSQGNFYVTVPGTVNWATAQMAIRTATGTLAMPGNASAIGNCNNCHDSTNRIVTP